MLISQKFKFNSQYKQNIYKLLEKNMKLKQYIVNTGTDKPLEGNLVFQSLKNDNIYLKPFDESCIQDKRVTIFIHPNNGDLRSMPVAKDSYMFDICVPLTNEIWETVDGERADLIAYEIINCLENVDEEIKQTIGDIEFIKYNEGHYKGIGILSLFANVEVITKAVV